MSPKKRFGGKNPWKYFFGARYEPQKRFGGKNPWKYFFGAQYEPQKRFGGKAPAHFRPLNQNKTFRPIKIRRTNAEEAILCWPNREVCIYT